jgi:hypothetical protein
MNRIRFALFVASRFQFCGLAAQGEFVAPDGFAIVVSKGNDV